MFGNFAFVLPIMMIMFGCAFAVTARWRRREARAWAAGYLIAGVAFCMPLVPHAVPVFVRAMVANALFAASYWYYGQALLERLGQTRFALRRAAILILSLGICAYAEATADLRLSLTASDFGCALLLAVPMSTWQQQIRLPGGKTLMIATSLVVIETLSRGITTSFTAPAHHGAFLSTLYAYLMQSLAMILGTVMALAGLGSIALGVLESYRGLAMTDPLSGLLNRRGFNARARTVGGSVVLCDIDRFKAINDRFGHAAGDRAIVTMAATINAALPPGATAARIGGEEFLIHLPAVEEPEAMAAAEQLRRAFETFDWPVVGIDAPLTASFGVSAYRANETTLDFAINRADRHLFEAKAAGRNRVIGGADVPRAA